MLASPLVPGDGHPEIEQGPRIAPRPLFFAHEGAERSLTRSPDQTMYQSGVWR